MAPSEMGFESVLVDVNVNSFSFDSQFAVLTGTVESFHESLQEIIKTSVFCPNRFIAGRTNRFITGTPTGLLRVQPVYCGGGPIIERNSLL